MVTTIEIALLVAALALLFGTYTIIKAVKPFIVNAVFGLIVLVIASFLGIGVEITPIAVLICAVGGIPGAILVILLAYLGIAFAGMAVPVGVLTLV
ncbi:MAG: pro-sigmaK processing inhibitor BofA family protein [Halobacteriota archaeon]|uniref:pro-sigmaK processing inhibitor BofA family protein n=1 Tax=Natronomonas sp. TaxID=2184060 RepID=UPI0039758B6A